MQTPLVAAHVRPAGSAWERGGGAPGGGGPPAHGGWAPDAAGALFDVASVVSVARVASSLPSLSSAEVVAFTKQGVESDLGDEPVLLEQRLRGLEEAEVLERRHDDLAPCRCLPSDSVC